MLPGIPIDHTIAQAVGASYDEDILVGGLQANHTLFAVIAYKAGEAPFGIDISAFTVAAGKITSETEDTDGYTLTVIYG